MLIALEGRRVVGTALLRIRGDVGEFSRLSVRPDARRRGIGRALVDRVVAESAAAGARELVWESSPWMSLAHEFYASLGDEAMRDPIKSGEF